MDQITREVLKVARSVLQESDLETVLERVLTSARTLTGAAYVALGVLDENRLELARFLTQGINPETRRLIGPLPRGRGVLGELIRNPVALRLDDVGGHPYSYGFPLAHPPMRTFLGVPIVVGGQPFGNLYLTEKAGGVPFGADDEEAVVALAEFAGLAIQQAGQKAASEHRLGEQDQRLEVLDATIQISRALGGETDLGTILELVAKRGRALVSARAILIEFVHGDELEIAMAAGEFPAELLGRRLALKDTVTSAALRTRQTQSLTDDVNRARFEHHGLGQYLAARDALVVPLLFRDRAFGALVAIDQLESGSFGTEHRRLLEAFAASAATAVATATSAADQTQAQRLEAAESERRRWARELHDETLEGLTSVRSNLAAALHSRDGDEVDKTIGEAVGQLEADIANLRSLIAELRPAALDELGLEPAVQALVGRMSSRGVKVKTDIDLAYERGREPERHSAELETAQYRIVQEALANTVKHAAAERAEVRIAESERFVSLTIRDDGRGFDPARHSGLGLLGMRERAELLGGDLRITSAPGQGTTVSAVLPVVRRSTGTSASAQGEATA